MVYTQAAPTGGTVTPHAVVDAAIHNDVPSSKPLYPYLPGHWMEQIENTVFKGPVEPYFRDKA